MAIFMNKLCTEQDRQQFRLISPLQLVDEIHGLIEVPADYVTDYASLKSFKNIFLFVLYALLVTYGNRAATVHDWLYNEGVLTRKDCDDVFFRALRADGVALWRTWIFYLGVRVGGAGHYT